MLYKNNKIEDFTKINLYNEIKTIFVNQNKNVIFFQIKLNNYFFKLKKTHTKNSI